MPVSSGTPVSVSPGTVPTIRNGWCAWKAQVPTSWPSGELRLNWYAAPGVSGSVGVIRTVPSASAVVEKAIGGSTMRRRAASMADVPSSILRRNPLASPTTPLAASSAVRSATWVHGLAANREPGSTVGTGVPWLPDPVGVAADAEAPAEAPATFGVPSEDGRQTSIPPTSATTTAAAAVSASGPR